MAMLHIGKFTSTELTPDGDEYVTTEFDEAGERKVTPDGHLLGGREYCMSAFTLPERGNRLYMMATECARELNYRDSYLLFNKNKSLFKIIASQRDKETLISAGLLPYSFRSRQIALVTARSMFCQFGSRIIKGGKRVRDDYWEGKAIEQGFTENDPVISDKRTLAAHQQLQMQNQQGPGHPQYQSVQPPMSRPTNSYPNRQSGGPPPAMNYPRYDTAQQMTPQMMQQPPQTYQSPHSAPRVVQAQAYPAVSREQQMARTSAVAVAASAASQLPKDETATQNNALTLQVLHQLMSSGNVSGYFIPGSDIPGSFDYSESNDTGHPNNTDNTSNDLELRQIAGAFTKSLGAMRKSKLPVWESFWLGRLESNKHILEQERSTLIQARTESEETDRPEKIPDVHLLHQPIKGELEQGPFPDIIYPDPPLVQKVRRTGVYATQPTPTSTIPAPMVQAPMANQYSVNRMMRNPQFQQQAQQIHHQQAQQAQQAQQMQHQHHQQQQQHHQQQQQAAAAAAAAAYYSNPVPKSQHVPQHQQVNWRGQPAAWNNYH